MTAYICVHKKNLTKEEAETILKQYTDSNFTIEQFEENEKGEIIVIIKFNDVEDSKKFVRSVNEGRTLDFIQRASIVPARDDSFISITVPETVVLLIFGGVLIAAENTQLSIPIKFIIQWTRL